MKKLTYILLATLSLSLFPANTVQAQGFLFFKGKKSKTAAADTTSAPQKSAYDKLITDGKKRTTATGTPFTVHRIGDKVWLEVPYTTFGRDVLLSSHIDRTSDLSLDPGSAAMTPKRYNLTRTDSLVLFTVPSYNVYVSDNDPNVSRALELSRSAANSLAFPIAAVNNDSTAVVFDATGLFYVTNKDILRLNGRTAGGGTVTASSLKTDNAFIYDVQAYEGGVSVSSETGAKLTLQVLIFASEAEASLGLTVSLTLLPDERMQPREADKRIGTGYYAFTGFTADGGTKPGYFATRWRLEPKDGPDADGLREPAKPVTIHIDTLFSPEWYRAIEKGIMSWDAAFRKAGYKNALRVTPYPSDSTFNANDPLVSVVRYSAGTGTSVTGRNLTDPRTGEILSTTITVPRDYVQGLRRNSVNVISAVDPRYSQYFLSTDAVCEALTANIIQQTGLALGLTANYAGSRAYNPTQLRDPDFTQRNGFTASVLDRGVLFNYMALPGDRERGVKTVIDSPGTYDLHAIQWLYGTAGKDTLDKLLTEKEGDPRYFYGAPPASYAYTYDPRAIANDLGDDPFTAADRLTGHLSHTWANADRWLADDRIPEDYAILFPDFIWLRFNTILSGLCSYIGGIYINDAHDGNNLPPYEPVPADLQRRALLKTLSLVDEATWLDSNPRLMNRAGLDRNIHSYTFTQTPMMYIVHRLLGRSGAMQLSANLSGKDAYTVSDAMADVTGFLTSDIDRGRRISPNRMTLLSNYVQLMVGSNRLLKANYDNNARVPAKTGAITDPAFDLQAITDQFEALTTPGNTTQAAPGAPTVIDYYFPADVTPAVIVSLKNVRARLQSGMAYCRDTYDRDRYRYLIDIIDKALDDK